MHHLYSVLVDPELCPLRKVFETLVCSTSRVTRADASLVQRTCRPRVVPASFLLQCVNVLSEVGSCSILVWLRRCNAALVQAVLQQRLTRAEPHAQCSADDRPQHHSISAIGSERQRL